MISSDFRQEARRKLQGKWGKGALIILAYFLITLVIGFVEGLFPESMASILSITVTVIEVPIAFGLIIAFVKLYNNEEVKAFDFLNLGFSNFKKSWGLAFRTALKMIVPIILIIVSYVLIGMGIVSTAGSVITGSSSGFGAIGIIGILLLIFSLIWATTKSFYYSLSYFVAIDNPEMSSTEAVEKSAELMKGKRWKLFCLQFSFIGWAILSIFTLGIGILWLAPYMQFATISFYKNAIENAN